MGLFGDMDANEVSDNPFYIAPDVYSCVLTDLVVRDTKDDSGRKGLSFTWTVEEEDNEYDGSNVSEWINLYLDSDQEEAAGASAVKRDRARLKSRLLQIGMSIEEMNDFLNDEGYINEDVQEKYIGTVAYVEIKESPGKEGTANEGKIFTNITKVTLPDAD